jgi:hypothetical protein
MTNKGYLIIVAAQMKILPTPHSSDMKVSVVYIPYLDNWMYVKGTGAGYADPRSQLINA